MDLLVIQTKSPTFLALYSLYCVVTSTKKPWSCYEWQRPIKIRKKEELKRVANIDKVQWEIYNFQYFRTLRMFKCWWEGPNWDWLIRTYHDVTSPVLWYFFQQLSEVCTKAKRKPKYKWKCVCVCVFLESCDRSRRARKLRKLSKEPWKSWAMIWRYLYHTEFLVTTIRIISDNKFIKQYFIPHGLSSSAREFGRGSY